MLLKEHEDDGRICASLCGIIANIAEVSNTTLEFTHIHTIKKYFDYISHFFLGPEGSEEAGKHNAVETIVDTIFNNIQIPPVCFFASCALKHLTENSGNSISKIIHSFFLTQFKYFDLLHLQRETEKRQAKSEQH